MRAAFLLIAATLVLAAPAAGANALRVGDVDSSAYPTLRVSVVTPTASSSPPSLRENGAPVVGFEAENLARAKSVVLAIDRSRSMNGVALENAVAAARSFVASKQPDDRIALVAFGRSAVALTGFSSATIDVDAELRTLVVDGRQGTALRDAVALGSRLLAGEELPGRVLVVLTDGDDVSSTSTLAQAAAEAKRAGAAVYAIGIESSAFSPAELEELTSATGGAYFAAASSASLVSAYRSVADQLRRTWRLTYLTAARPGESVNVRASLAGSGAGSARATMPGKATGGSGSSRSLLPEFVFSHNLAAFLLALMTGACVLLAVGVAVSTPGGIRLRRRLDPHVTEPTGRRRAAKARERFGAASGVFAATEKSFAHRDYWRRLQRLIERADLPLRTVELFYMCIGAAVFLALFATAAGVGTMVVLAAFVAGGLAPVGFVAFKAKRRLAALDDQLPDILITIAASLKAGHSFRQGLQAVVDEGRPPAADEFRRVLTETSLGRSMDDALADMTDRVGSKHLDFVITAVTIQRQVGGSLAGIFDMVADAVRDRQQFARKIKGLTAMGRASAYVLIGIPFFLAGVLTLLNPKYMAPLWNTSTGHKLIMLGLFMMGLGVVFLRKIVSFRG